MITRPPSLSSANTCHISVLRNESRPKIRSSGTALASNRNEVRSCPVSRASTQSTIETSP